MAGLTAMNFLARGAIPLPNICSTHRASVKYCLVDFVHQRGTPLADLALPKNLTDVWYTHIAVSLVSHCLSDTLNAAQSILADDLNPCDAQS